MKCRVQGVLKILALFALAIFSMASFSCKPPRTSENINSFDNLESSKNNCVERYALLEKKFTLSQEFEFSEVPNDPQLANILKEIGKTSALALGEAPTPASLHALSLKITLKNLSINPLFFLSDSRFALNDENDSLRTVLSRELKQSGGDCLSSTQSGLNLVEGDEKRKGAITSLALAPEVEEYQALKNLIYNDLELDEITLADEPKKVTVVGGGPLGMFASIDAAKAGFDVSLVEKRKFYTRNQVLNLSDKTLAKLTESFSPKVLTKLQDNGYLKRGPLASRMVIKHLEMILALKLDKMAEFHPKLNVIRGGEVFKKGDGSLHILTDGRLSPVDAEFVIGADGKNGIVGEASGIKTRVVSEPTYAAIAAWDNLDGVIQGARLDNGTTLVSGRGAYSFTDFTEDQYRVFQELDDIAKRKYVIDEFIKRFKFISLPDPENPNSKKKRKITGDELRDFLKNRVLTGKLDVAAFPIEITRSDHFSGTISGEGKTIRSVLVGDSVRTTHFFTGSSIEDAMEHLRLLNENIFAAYKGNSQNLEEAFENFDKQLDEATEKYHKKIFRNLPDVLTKVEGEKFEPFKSRALPQLIPPRPVAVDVSKINSPTRTRIKIRLTQSTLERLTLLIENYYKILDDIRCEGLPPGSYSCS